MCRAPETTLRQAHLEAGHLPASTAGGALTGVEVYVMARAELDEFALAQPGNARIEERGPKSETKSLAEYFAGRGGMFRLRADYSMPGQAERGVRALIEKTAGLGVGGRYFVGVTPALFDALWTRANAQEEPASTARARSSERALREDLNELEDLHPDLVIPPSVREKFIGDSPAVRKVHYQIVLAARYDYPVLIQGETGTGKDVVAREIHRLYARPDGKCIFVNCGGIPSELFESELFGHVKGSFTNSTRDKAGLWRDAQDGTLFLDEVGDLPLDHQRKVLRVIEAHTFRPVGANEEIETNARVLSATHRNLEGMVREGRFGADLYQRLVTILIRTPALRDIREDIPAITQHLWSGMRKNDRQVLPDEVVAQLRELPLPGNVRELRSILAGMLMLADGKPVTSRLLRFVLRDRGSVGFDG
jgi:transcriptional regulator with GAF, ATPase, and Fis domain